MEGGGAALVTAAGDMTLGHCTRMMKEQHTIMFIIKIIGFGASMKCVCCAHPKLRDIVRPITPLHIRAKRSEFKHSC